VWAFDGVEMMLVPAGCFEMGSTRLSRDEEPVHRVCFEEPFWIDRYEVTNGQFAAFNGRAATASYFSGNERPREQITWSEASDFCESRGARLPTEAEWEYAARGPDAWVYPWGDGWIADNVVWGGNSGGQTANVGSKPEGASWVGAEDLSGNVWEWVADWYDVDYYGTLADGVVNPTGPASGEYRVLRGGSWDYPHSGIYRGAIRDNRIPLNRTYYLGFRCVRSG
jgi:formylglycine-generating enzyme required for sulfatase activity